MVKTILKKVLEGLHCFHKLDLVYGSLTTRSVRVQFPQSFDSGEAVDVQIVDFDLSKSVVSCLFFCHTFVYRSGLRVSLSLHTENLCLASTRREVSDSLHLFTR